MTDVQLKSFLVLAEELNFTKASKKLCISQSTLSTHISSLEKNLGVTLFLRTNKTVELSPEGKIIFPAFERAYDMMRMSVRDAKILHGKHVNVFRFGFIEGLRQSVMNRTMSIIDEYCELKDGLQKEIYAMSEPELLKMLEEGQLDVILSLEKIVDIKTELHSKLVSEQQMKIMYSAIKYNENNPFDESCISKEKYVVVKRENSAVEEEFLKNFRELYGVPEENVIRVNSNEAKMFHISAGYGVGFSDNMTRTTQSERYGQYMLDDMIVKYGVIAPKNSKNPLVWEFYEYLDRLEGLGL